MTIEITINQGALKGSIKKSLNGDPYYSFQGIPYGKPPLGQLRFKAPEPLEKWEGTFDATKKGNYSMAKNAVKMHLVHGAEDCLNLSVFTKNLQIIDQSAKKPVMFWIHGGAFIFGTSSVKEFGPEYLLEEDVVLVTVTYRLGFLGFFALNDPSLEVTGNAGLKDIVLALKWVQANIGYFGGDPKNVTVFGQSAGAAISHCLMLSPLAKGLFHKAIAQSGTMLNSWALGKSPIKKMKALLGLPNADDKTILKILQDKPAEEIFEIQYKFQDNSLIAPRPFNPIVDKHAKEPFLPDKPINLIYEGRFYQVPLMLGYNSNDGMCFEIGLIRATFEKQFKLLIPWTLGYANNDPRKKELEEMLEKYYHKLTDNDEKEFTYSVLTDAIFTCGIYEVVKYQSQKSHFPIYLYRMSLETKLNIYKKFLKIKQSGVAHCDELGYLFKSAVTPEIEKGSLEEESIKRFTKLWANFAKFGNPTPAEHKSELIDFEWKASAPPNYNILDIGEKIQLLNIKTCPDRDRIQMWEQLFQAAPSRVDICNK